MGTASGGSERLFTLVLSDSMGGEDEDTRGPVSPIAGPSGSGGADGRVEQGWES